MKFLNGENFEVSMDLERGLFVIFISSGNCGPCRSMGPVLERFEKMNSKLPLYKVNAEESPELLAHFGVRGVPHLLFCKRREVLYEFSGMTPLKDLQYVVDNIDGAHFLTYGEFKGVEKKTDWPFILSIGTILAVFTALFILT